MNQVSSRARRRPPRRQPHRNCKRLRYEDGSRQPCLQELPDDVLRPILEFTLMDPEVSDNTEVWRWIGHLSRVCQSFQCLARKLAPRGLILGRNEASDKTDLLIALIHSIRDTPWKGNKIQGLEYNGFHLPDRNHQDRRHQANNRRILEALRSLFEKRGALPNLCVLLLEIFHDDGVIDVAFLYSLARNLPSLRHLRLADGYGPSGDFLLGERVTPVQFGRFARMFRMYQAALELQSCRMTSQHLDPFLREHGPYLRRVDVDFNLSTYTEEPRDAILRCITENCANLERLQIRASRVTCEGLEPFLEANPNIRRLDLAVCLDLDPDAIEILVRHAPQLETLGFRGARWFTDDCLERLVQGQIDYWVVGQGKEEISLRCIQAEFSLVTAAGVARVLSNPCVGQLVVKRSSTP